MPRLPLIAVLVLALSVLAFAPSPPATAQLPGPAQQIPVDRPPPQPILVPQEKTYGKKLEAAQDYLREKRWDEAFAILERLQAVKDDVFLPLVRKKDDKETIVWINFHAELNRILDDLDPAGVTSYRKRHEDTAKTLLQEATRQKSLALLAELAERFPQTEAGNQAQIQLARRLFDAGDYTAAARGYERLFRRQRLVDWDPLDLFQAAAVFHRAGASAEEDKVWKALEEHVEDNRVRLGSRVVKREDLRTEMEQVGTQPSKPLSDWPLYRGNPARDAQGKGGPAFLEAEWKQGTIREETTTRIHVTTAMNSQLSRGLPVLPAFFPITATVENGKDTMPLVIFRSYFGVHAVDARSGKLRWESDSRWAIDKMMRDHRKMPHINMWINQWIMMGQRNLLWENSVTGTVSTDGQLVYVVDDLQVPPFVANFTPNPPGDYSGEPLINEAVLRSEMDAYDLRDGKIVWHLGGFGEKKDDPAGELRDSYFLGAPLPLDGKLYILTAKKKQLRLVCVDPTKNPERENPVVWSKPLGEARESLDRDIARRIRAVPLAAAEGILVCPTEAGTVFGVDLLTHRIVWASIYHQDEPAAAPAAPPARPFRYNPIFPAGMPAMLPGPNDWKGSAPVIVDGKVVFTSLDDPKIHCLRLKDGTPLWTAPRTEDDLYLAGVWSGKVVVVTKRSVRSLNLTDGNSGWKAIETGLPSGQGVASDNVYYLPLRHGIVSRKPEVCAIDVRKGILVSHSETTEKEPPGNLLFFDKRLISQTTTDVSAYKLLTSKIEEVDRKLANNPNDPAGRFERGQLRVASGDLRGAVEDLAVAVNADNKPPAELLYPAWAKLHLALAELLRRDFATNEKLLPLFEQSCKVEIKNADLEKDARLGEERRRANYLMILGRGREQQGKLAEAFEAYSRLTVLWPGGELLPSSEEADLGSSVPAWTAGRIRALFARANADQRKAIEEVIDKEWTKVRDGKDLDALKEFVDRFDMHTRAGREARLLLANRLGEQKGTDALLKSEALLLQVARQTEDRTAAGRAVESLAQLLAQKDQLADAAYYYGLLKRDFGTTTIRDNKTGSQLFDEAFTDKRFLPFLQPDETWKGKVKAMPPERGSFLRKVRLFGFEIEGDPLPYFQRNRLALNIDFHEFRVIDRTTGEDRFKKNLDRGGNNFFNQLVFNNNQGGSTRFPARTLGHLVVLQLGHMAYGIDPINQRVCWTRNLMGTSGVPAQPNMVMDADGTLQIFSQDGFVQRLCVSGPIEPGCLCLQTLDALLAVDPITGETLWSRGDVKGNCRVFGDADAILVVEMNREGQPTAGRAFRASEGTTLDVPDFTAANQNRVRILGRTILVKDAAPDGLTLRLYDALTGKDLWKERFAANSIFLRTEDPELCGAATPDGTFTAIDSRTGKKLFEGKLYPKQLSNALAVNLLQDRDQFYVGVQMPNDPNVNPYGGPWVNVMPDTGVRELPLNGMFYAFDKSTGNLKWRESIHQQMLILGQYKELPILLFTSRSQKLLGPAGRQGAQQVVAIKAIDKRNGKLLFDEPEMLNGPQFHTYRVDPGAGKIELIAPNYKLTFAENK